jgi:hypothetical protein
MRQLTAYVCCTCVQNLAKDHAKKMQEMRKWSDLPRCLCLLFSS